jgi:hypothetical protein
MSQTCDFQASFVPKVSPPQVGVEASSALVVVTGKKSLCATAPHSRSWLYPLRVLTFIRSIATLGCTTTWHTNLQELARCPF